MPHTILRSCAVVISGVAVMAAAGCAASSATPAAAPAAVASAPPAQPAAGPRPARGNANLIVESEIVASSARNALELIQQLRPAMFRARNGAADEQPGGVEIVIYIDGTRAGSRETLTGVLSQNVKEIRYINASDATTRFGTGHPLGAIMVVTKR